MALIIGEPKGLKGFTQRLAVSAICGLFFADALGEWLGWSMIVPNRIIAASCLASAMGWYVLHALIRTAQMWKPK